MCRAVIRLFLSSSLISQFKNFEEIVETESLHSLFLGPCFEEGITFYGNDVELQRNIENPKACQTLCQNNIKCMYWTYGVTKHAGNCWLKSEDSGRRSNPGLTSGPKLCSKFNLTIDTQCI